MPSPESPQKRMTARSITSRLRLLACETVGSVIVAITCWAPNYPREICACSRLAKPLATVRQTRRGKLSLFFSRHPRRKGRSVREKNEAMDRLCGPGSQPALEIQRYHSGACAAKEKQVQG